MNKWLLLASLYAAQFLPVAFFGQTIPIFLRQQGVSLELIGLTSLISLPWMLKVFWSPFVDKYGYTKWGHYKFWIIFMQSLLVIAITLCAFLKVESNFVFLLGVMFLAIVFAATQDIATDALAIGLLKPSERGFGNSIQVAGGYLGSILGGGVALIVLSSWGWKICLLLIALVIFLLMLPVLSYQENVANSRTNHQLSWLRLREFFRQQGTIQWIIVLVVYMMGISIASTISRPLLVDLGMSLKDIGVMNSFASFGGGASGSLAGGFLIKFLGRKQSLIIFGSFMSIASMFWILLIFGLTNLPIIYLAATGLSFTYSMACIPIFTVAMDRSRQDNAGFDYTLQATTIYLGSMVSGTLLCLGGVWLVATLDDF